MDLTSREKDKMMIFTAGLLAERRLARGVILNYPETIAYISAALLEGARDGRTVAELMHAAEAEAPPTVEMGGVPRGPCATLHIPGRRGDGWGAGFAIY